MSLADQEARLFVVCGKQVSVIVAKFCDARFV